MTLTSYRCNYCERNWPETPDFKDCPCCRERCTISGSWPIHSDEANELRQEFAFGWWLWDTGRL